MINLVSPSPTSGLNPSLNHSFNHDDSESKFNLDAYLKNEADFFDQSFKNNFSALATNRQTIRVKQSNEFKQEPVGITEITTLDQGSDSIYFIAPFLSTKSMQHDKRWITCITTKNISKTECQTLGINTQRLRLIRISNASDILWVTWEALAAGNSQCVLSHLDSISSEESRQLRNAAILGNCHGLLLTTEKSYRA